MVVVSVGLSVWPFSTVNDDLRERYLMVTKVSGGILLQDAWYTALSRAYRRTSRSLVGGPIL